MLKVSEPDPPLIMSFPKPPVMMSLLNPPEIISFPLPPVITSTPVPPEMVKSSVWELRFTVEPKSWLVLTTSIFLKLASEAKTWVPVDNCKVSISPRPS